MLLTSSAVADLFHLREPALRKRVSRGTFPAPSDGCWDSSVLAAHALAGGTPHLVPPHWHEPGSLPVRFIDVVTVRDSAFLRATVGATRVGIAYLGMRTPQRELDRTVGDLDIDVLYEAKDGWTTTGVPEMAYDGIVAERSSEVWSALSRVLGFALPWWNPLLWDERIIRAWHPGSPAIAAPVQATWTRSPAWDIAMRTLMTARDDEILVREWNYWTAPRHAAEADHFPDSPVLARALVPQTREQDDDESVPLEELEAIPFPQTPALASAARTVLAGSDALDSAFVVRPGTTNLLERALLTQETEADEAFNDTLLALALRGDTAVAGHDAEFRALPQGGGHIAALPDGSTLIVPPRTMAQTGAPVLFSAPNPASPYPLYMTDDGRAWPFPLTGGLTAYTVGYRGTGPTCYAVAVSHLLARTGQALRLAAKPAPLDGEPLTTPGALLAFAGEVPAMFSADEARLRLRTGEAQARDEEM